MSLSNNFPTIPPTLLLDFANVGRLDPRITFTRATTATFFNSLGVLTTASSGVARFDYNPSTLAPRGLLIEEQRTNSIRNNTGVGAVAGTPGTVPTNWNVSSGGSGITRTLVGTGTEDGIAYIDLAFSGTGSGSAFQVINTDTTTAIAAATGQAWSGSFYLKLVAGSTTGTNITMQLLELASGSGVLQNLSSALSPTTQALKTQRITLSSTLSGGVTITNLQQGLRLLFTNGVAVDITLRIGLPQLELGAFATSVIPTTTTALTRNADSASMTGTNFSSWFNASEGTIFCQGIGVNNVATGTRRYFEINNNTPDERVLAGYGFTTACRYLVSDNAATQADIGVTTTTGGALVKFAGAYKTNDFQQASNGTLGTADTSGTLPTVDRMFIGQAETTAAATMLNGYIQRIAYYPTRLPNATLQALTL